MRSNVQPLLHACYAFLRFYFYIFISIFVEIFVLLRLFIKILRFFFFVFLRIYFCVIDIHQCFLEVVSFVISCIDFYTSEIVQQRIPRFLSLLSDHTVTKPAAASLSSCVIVSSLDYKFIKRASNKRQKEMQRWGEMCCSHAACMCACKRDYECAFVCVYIGSSGGCMERDNSYTSLYKAISREPIKRAGWSWERIVFGLMLVVLICNFSSVWAQRKNKPIRKQRQTTLQPDNAVLIYSSLRLLFVSLLYSLSLHPSPPLSPTEEKVFSHFQLYHVFAFMWLNKFSVVFLFLFPLFLFFLSFDLYLFISVPFLPLSSSHYICLSFYLFSVPLRCQLSVTPPEQHRGGARPRWDRPPRGPGQSE